MPRSIETTCSDLQACRGFKEAGLSVALNGDEDHEIVTDARTKYVARTDFGWVLDNAGDGHRRACLCYKAVA